MQFTTSSYPPSPYYRPVVDGNVVCTPEYIVTGAEPGRRELSSLPSVAARVPAPTPQRASVVPTNEPGQFNPYAASVLVMPRADHVRMMTGT